MCIANFVEITERRSLDLKVLFTSLAYETFLAPVRTPHAASEAVSAAQTQPTRRTPSPPAVPPPTPLTSSPPACPVSPASPTAASIPPRPTASEHSRCPQHSRMQATTPSKLHTSPPLAPLPTPLTHLPRSQCPEAAVPPTQPRCRLPSQRCPVRRQTLLMR